MDEVMLKVKTRTEQGKQHAKLLRNQGRVPAVVYSKGSNILLSIGKKDLKYLRQHNFSENIIIKLNFEDDSHKEETYVLLKEYQRDPLTEEVIHLDFVKVSMKEKVEVEVPIEFKGEAEGIKEGGVLEHLLWSLKIECYPKDIPETITVDVSSINAAHSLHIKDLSLPDNIRVLNDPQDVIATVSISKPEEASEEEPSLEESSKGPEVLKEKKQKES